jgi:hypothetical protein
MEEFKKWTFVKMRTRNEDEQVAGNERLVVLEIGSDK